MFTVCIERTTTMTKTYFMEMEITLEMILWIKDHHVRQHTQLWHFLNDSKRTVFCTKSCINTEQKKTWLMEEDPQNLATKSSTGAQTCGLHTVLWENAFVFPPSRDLARFFQTVALCFPLVLCNCCPFHRILVHHGMICSLLLQ